MSKDLLIKVCGINRTKNLSQIGELGVDMIGLNFYLGSKRFIGNTIINLKPHIKRVGVFVDATIDEILQYKDDCRLDYAQLHGSESVEFCQTVQKSLKVIKAFGIDEEFDFQDTMPYSFCEMFLFDTKNLNHGGSGKKFNWDKLNEYEGDVPFLLAGGISSEDIDDIMNIKHEKFLGIDINSKFEREPGHKNVQLVEYFVNQIKNR